MSMRVKLVMMLFALAFTQNITVCAQQLTRKQINSINYFDENHLIRKYNNLSVVSLDLEWPTRLYNTDATPLQSFLCSNVFGENSVSLNEAKKNFLSKFGTEIYEMPEEDGIKKTYVNIELKMVAWIDNVFLSMMLIKTVRDGSKLEPDQSETILLTYDFENEKVLTTDDILKKDSQKDKYYSSYLAYDIFYEYFQDEVLFMANKDNLSNMPDQACLMPTGVLFNIVGLVDEDGKEQLVLLPTRVSEFYIKKNMLKLLLPYEREKIQKKRIKEKENDVFKLNEEVDSDGPKVYDVVPVMPKYEGGEKAMMDYIVENAHYDEYEKIRGVSGKVVVQFTVKDDGTVSDPAVIKPVSPRLDREAVKAIMSMPKWLPGEIDGQKVNVRICLPVTFKISLYD